MTADNTPDYGFSGQIWIAKIVSVYDGDTCTAVVKINGVHQKIKVRCYGYDSPEMKLPAQEENREEKIKKAIVAKEALSELCLNKIVRLKIHGFDKYGRFLGTIYLGNWFKENEVNKIMIENGHGYPYRGGTKRN
jgi:micrococcal nuclease